MGKEFVDPVLLEDAKSEMPPGTQVVLINSGDKFTSGYLLLPNGSQLELPPEALGSRKSWA